MEEEDKTRIKVKKDHRVECLDCQCIGRLKISGGKILLFPEKVLTIRSMTTQKEDVQKSRTYMKSALEKLKISKQSEIGNYNFSIFLVGTQLQLNFSGTWS